MDVEPRGGWMSNPPKTNRCVTIVKQGHPPLYGIWVAEEDQSKEAVDLVEHVGDYPTYEDAKMVAEH
jgi:hypothetical protein